MVPTSKTSSSNTPWASQKTMRSTLPAEVVVLTFFRTDEDGIFHSTDVTFTLGVKCYWDILLLPPILILLDGFHNNIQDHEELSGDSNPEARGRHTQESKFKEQKKHFTSLDILVQLMIQEELQRLGNKSAASSK
ncbi:hypothetical protein TNIN_467401 [Trichonephila inaurata madagascariensis]|uniref:Uncharacterized protein n=1 Tax=Trichonephila inaurata madagascariensis TaxID=2747483 RepID=A0A8X6XPL1_9ARAC|nr:hypothetical protein TNIN_467401 [Trichonephila inaurata madagascariensis]